MALSEWRRCFTSPGFGREVARKCEPNWHLVWTEGNSQKGQNITFFYNAHLNTTVLLKGVKYLGGVGYKDHVTVLECCSVNVSKELCPLIVGNLKSCIAWNVWGITHVRIPIIHNFMDDWKIVQRVAGLFRDENGLLEEECASVNGSVCCP